MQIECYWLLIWGKYPSRGYGQNFAPRANSINFYGTITVAVMRNVFFYNKKINNTYVLSNILTHFYYTGHGNDRDNKTLIFFHNFFQKWVKKEVIIKLEPPKMCSDHFLAEILRTQVRWKKIWRIVWWTFVSRCSD